MKRSITLVAFVFVLCVGTQRSHACCCETTYRSMNSTFVVGDTRWILYNGVVYRNSMSTDAATASRRYIQAATGSRISFAPIDRTTFPSLLHYTSETTPLVSGRIARILLDDRNRLWAFNDNGDASMFDGVAWETLRHSGSASKEILSYYYKTGLDVIIRDGIMRIATSEYVDEIDMNRLVRRRLLEANGALNNPQFLGLDTITSIGYDNIIFIDLASNTIDIDSKIDSTNNGDTIYNLPHFSDQRMRATPIEIRSSGHHADAHEQRLEAFFWEYTFQQAPRALQSTLRSLNLSMSDTVFLHGWTPERTGAYLDMVADKNGTIYLAGFDGITVIPMTTEEDVVRDRPTPLATATLYPNPATHHVTIGLEAASAQRVSALLVDASGTTVATADLRDPSTLVDLTPYPNGMYTVVLTSDHARTARSLIVQR
ncbi:MAG: T9SS type A sorting domain-containing protein [Bacteroidetes bacterium]|nr:T9SS type A sorting domain-containing protein [Bacteroidota bacterium]